MRFFPQGDEDVRRMLDVIGVEHPADLFRSIPESLRLEGNLDLPRAQTEIELRATMEEMARRNATTATHPCFLGAGAYNHHVPAAVGQLLLRSEFYTSYTPYQPEISQGTLQATFEYQTMIAALTELDFANASLYDGASACAEAVLTAQRVARGGRVVLSAATHPHYRRVVRSYVRNLGLEVVEAPVAADGRTDLDALADALGGPKVSVVVIQNPNFFGCVEDLARTVPLAKESGALVAVAISEALSLGLLHGPGHYGADIAMGEGQSFGTPLSFGGPFLGFMAARQAFLRQMPGRLVGETRDSEGRRGYVLTLATREQHIRREKATSNICTNQGLNALAATIYMSLMGREGIREVARQNRDKASWARERLEALPGCTARFSAPIFNEFVLDLPRDAGEVGRALLARGILGGLPLGGYVQGMDRSMLFCVTEMNSRDQIENLAASLEEILR